MKKILNFLRRGFSNKIAGEKPALLLKRETAKQVQSFEACAIKENELLKKQFKNPIIIQFLEKVEWQRKEDEKLPTFDPAMHSFKLCGKMESIDFNKKY